ncbi:MAG: hypothetical protein KPEEDBHJ_02251 [Anaerolineales bacterium]|nr:hypothetical protein [Anaerolineales bacterium]
MMTTSNTFGITKAKGRGRGGREDLTLIGGADRRVRLTYPPALPKWEGS